MRVAFITQWFPPEPAIVPAEIADGLAALGHDVDVLTGFPNYPDGVLQDGWKLRPYHRSARSDRVTVHRAPLYPNHDGRPAHRFANYSSFAFGAVPAAIARLPRPDVWLTYSSPATASIPTLAGRMRGRAPATMIIQDLWPESVTQSGMASGRAAAAIERPLHRFCDFTYRHCAAVGVISPSMREILKDRGVPDAKIYDTPNWVRDDTIAPDGPVHSRKSLGLPAGPLFVYAGNLGPMQNLGPVVSSFADQDRAQLLLLGSGIEEEKLRSCAGNAANIHFREPVPFDEVGLYLSSADALVVSVADTPLLRATMPSKMQTSLAAGKPILVHGAGDVAEVVLRAGAGVSARPGDQAQLSDAIAILTSASTDSLTYMGRNARQHYLANFSPVAGARRVEAMLAQAVEEGGRDVK